ncbi:MAG: formylglycine-generating enzyme family protein [Chloroflexi bacterium]|nr:formylglycine-generating enzyme family protein [Chloroflexota bacterium]
MVVVPAGEFLMGSASDPLAFGHETPQHRVHLDTFWLDQFETTNGLYARCVAAGACRPPAQNRSNIRANYYSVAEFADYPVIYVSWSDAEAYCHWVGKRLPTEAEWEKAARGPAAAIYPWGNAFDARHLNSIEGGPGDTTRVGSYPVGASVYGAQDMAGNVWEWVADVYQSDYYRISPAANPPGPDRSLPPSEAIGVLRGGAWNNDLRAVRAANRLNYFQRHVGFEAGIRCAWSG